MRSSDCASALFRSIDGKNVKTTTICTILSEYANITRGTLFDCVREPSWGHYALRSFVCCKTVRQRYLAHLNKRRMFCEVPCVVWPLV